MLTTPGASVPPLLIRRASLMDGRRVDVRTADGVIAHLADELAPRAGDVVVDARDGLLLPGLHDHHLHLFATAAADASLCCGPPDVLDEASLREALQHLAGAPDEWVRGTGFHESVCRRLDRHWLDEACPDRPVRIQHRSGMMWVYNSRALERLRIDPSEPLPEGVERYSGGELTGRFFNLDDWLGERQARHWPSLRPLSARLASHGITAVTDTGVNNGAVAWRALRDAIDRGELLQRVLVMGTGELAAMAAQPHGLLAVGPVKLYLREIDLPQLDHLVARMRAAHVQDRAVAVHCVTRVELTYALAALREAGAVPGDRIEHASVADDHALWELADMGVTVVSQPHFIAERGVQYLEDVEMDDLPYLYRAASFLRSGVSFAAGSDAPYGATDPWAAMRAAVERRTEDAVLIGSAECLTPEQALALFGGQPHSPGTGLRTLEVGQPADLCLLDAGWDAVREDLSARHVMLTLRDGCPIYCAPPLSGTFSGFFAAAFDGAGPS